MIENNSFAENLKDFASKLSSDLLKKYQEEALGAYEGFLWRTKDYLSQKNREYKQASLNGMIKDIAKMVDIGKEMALLADTEEEKQYWMLRTDRNIGQQIEFCGEWLDKLGVKHQTWEEYLKDPFGLNK